MKQRHAIAHMQAAYVYANLSYCNRRKVGCVIVKNDSIIAIGYNGTDPGEENICEDENGVTKSNVRHAEDNAIRKLTKSPNDGNNSVMFVTTAPCRFCASRIVDAGIKTVYYDDVYHNEEGIEYLTKHGIEVLKLTMPE